MKFILIQIVLLIVIYTILYKKYGKNIANMSLICLVIFYFIFSLFYGYKGIFKFINVKKDKRIVVSLSTLPSRIKNIDKVIKSILKNKIKPDVIYINIPKYSKREKREYIIPDKIKNIEIVKINIIDEDYGPITKLYPTLLKEIDPETIIICIDDDKEYDKNLIKHLLSVSKKYPKDCVCISGWNYLNLGFYALPVSIGLNNIIKNVDILQCYNGVLYKRKFFEDDFKNIIKCKECLTTDDILISKYLKYKNINIKSVPYNFKHKDIENKGEFKLGNINIQNNNWIKCINKIINKI